jgi:hypothetical protein
MVGRICVAAEDLKKSQGVDEILMVSILLISPWLAGFVSAADDLKKSQGVDEILLWCLYC